MERSKRLATGSAEEFRMAVAGTLGPRLDRERFQWSSLLMLAPGSVVPTRAVIGSVVIVTWVLPEITVALIWYAFSQAGGTLSILLGHTSSNYLVLVPMLIVSLANLWRNVAFSMLVFSAGLRNL